MSPLIVQTIVAIAATSAACAEVSGAINVELRPVSSTVTLGDQAQIGLYFVSDDATTQFASAGDIIMAWDIAYLDLAGNDDTGAFALLASGFPAAHPSNLNQSFLDGDAMYVAFGNFGDPIPASPAGTLVTTFLFDTLALTAGTDIDIPLTLGLGESIIFDDVTPNLNVLGSVSGATITIVPIPAPAAWLALCACGLARPARRRTNS